MKRLSIFLFIVVLYFPALSPSQDGPQRGGRSAGEDAASAAHSDSAYHLTAGSSSLRDTLGGRILELTQGVEIVQEGLRMRGEEGEYHRDKDVAFLKQNVSITDRGWNVTCDQAVFFRTTGVVWLHGNVVASDSTTILKADSVFYDRKLLTAEAFSRVSVTNEREGFTVEGDHGFYFRNKREGMVDQNPHLIVDMESPEPAIADSDTMIFFPDTRSAVAYRRVKIIKGNTITQCDSAAIYDEKSIAELYGNPIAKQENASMRGETMLLHYNDDEVDRISLIGSALIEEKQLDTLVVGRDSWIRGDSMALYLHDNRIDSILVLRNCESEYYPAALKRVESNYAKGDTMFFQFERDTLAYVRITGNASGIYNSLDIEEGVTSDSLRAIVDTTLTFLPFYENADKVVYGAKRIEYFAREKDITLRKDARLNYQNRQLLGDKIVYHSTLQLLDATGSPVLIEGSDKFYGDEMGYDLESEAGIVKNGSTKFMEGYYNGEEVAKVGDNVMKVWNSTYTTCDLKKPHYHFASNEMKVYLKDKVVSGPIRLYIGNTPIAYLPFLANNIRKGRRSGILRPEFEFGITRTTGRFIRNFGYFWATNDYTDFEIVGDFNEDSSFRLFLQNRYKLRYRFSGNVDLSLYRDLQSFRNEWTLSSSHSQTLGEKFSLTSDLRFVSSDQAPSAISRIDDVENVINRRIESKVSVRKSWNSIGFSASGRRVQKLNITDPNTVRIQTTFPQISLSIPSRNLYFGKATKRGEKSFLEKFLGGIRYSPGISGNRITERRLYESKEVITSSQSLNFSSPLKIGFVNVSPSLSMGNKYTRTTVDVKKHTESTGAEDSVIIVPSSYTVMSDNEFRWSTGGRVGTNLYGTFYPEIGPLIGIRHTLSPSASYSYQPAIGGRPSTQRLSVSVNNSIDLKVRKGNGGEEKEGKEQKLSGVLIWGLSSSYDPKAPKGEGWSTVSSRVNLRLFGASISMNQSIEPYDGELLSTSITSSVSLNGTHGFGSSSGVSERDLNVIARDTTSGVSVSVEGSGAGPPEPVEPEREGDPWNLSLSFSYSKSRSGDPRSTLRANGSFHLTKNWRITYSANYDVENRMLMGQNYSIYRDLHCWEMSFSRQKLGEEWQYYFRINVKAHTDIYAESGRRGLGRGGVGLPFSY